MGEPERNEDEEPAAEDGTPAGPKPVAKPDWLVGAHEALEAEFSHPEADPDRARPELRSAVPPPPRDPERPRPVNPYQGFAQSAAGRSFTSGWMESGYSTASRPPSSDPPAPAETESATHPSTPDDDEPADETNELAGPGTPTAEADKALWVAPEPPRKPWWESLLVQALTPAGLAFAGGAAIAIVLAVVLLGPKDTSVSLARIRHHPGDYDGRSVKVHGKVGEVYSVGGGYSFYLLQGRDTMVVFTRSRTPVTNAHVTVSGVINVGVLDGEQRQALFETAAQP